MAARDTVRSTRPHVRFVQPAIWTIAVVLVLAAPAARLTAAPIPPDSAQDQGPTAAETPITVSLILRVRNPGALEQFVQASQDPASPQFHRFLSLGDFVQRFAPAGSDIASIRSYLASFGIQTTDVYADRLVIKATGTAAAFDQAFSVDLHDYTRHGRRFHRPRHAPRVPVLLRDLLVAVAGLSNEAAFHPMHIDGDALAAIPTGRPLPSLPATGTATGVPGSYTVGDVANFYDINPLYDAHLSGAGRTIGIATLADFDPADAYTYWSLIGLPVTPHRITQVHVDGGGELSADAGSGETAIDVEQSGGIAPGARMVVYDAPNTDAGFIDLFYRAASDNLVDSLSVSWGLSEVYYLPDSQGNGDFTAELVAFHQAFLELAAQGISTFAASGDNGAYDANFLGFNQPIDNVISVEAPASDPAITAAGGTTTPIVLNLGPGTPDLVVPREQVWGWDYLQDYLVDQLGPQWENALFPVGTGGGVSVFWPRPPYQNGTPGMRTTEPGQQVVQNGQLLLNLPAHFRGRNLPDVSLNADPESGYLMYSTPDGGLSDGWGGTSFVAPQLNGVAALLGQMTHGRLGLWNPMLYRFQRMPRRQSPLVDIRGGDNWFYRGIRGYEPGAGLGVLDVANLANAVAREAFGVTTTRH